MTDLALFLCCREPVADDQFWLSPLGAQPTDLDIGEATGEVVPLRRDVANARHEAAHAIVQIALGGKIETATIDGPSFVKAEPGLPRSSRVVMLLAGPAADAWT